VTTGIGGFDNDRINKRERRTVRMDRGGDRIKGTEIPEIFLFYVDTTGMGALILMQ
jgi:hypothetical protein